LISAINAGLLYVSWQSADSFAERVVATLHHLGFEGVKFTEKDVHDVMPTFGIVAVFVAVVGGMLLRSFWAWKLKTHLDFERAQRWPGY